MVPTDCYLLYRFGNSGRDLLDLNSFWDLLGTELVQNEFNGIGTCRANQFERDTSMDEELWTGGSGIYLSPTKNVDVPPAESSWIKESKDCAFSVRKEKMMSMWVCSQCGVKEGNENFLCHPKNGRDCFTRHLNLMH